MKEVLSWFVEHYELIIFVGACLLDIVLFLFGVIKKGKKTPSIDLAVMLALPMYIREAEKLDLDGSSKLFYVLTKVKELYKHETGVELASDSFMISWITNKVEDILDTPQKKGK